MSKLPWEGPLFQIKGQLAERYALALQQIRGLTCPFAEFSIDRMGWSPQLAAVLGDDYLGGEALRYAIILSTDQANAPLLRRRFSYEAGLIEKVYLEARPTLLNLIEYEPVIVELDSGLTFCRSAVDLLSVQAATARIDTPRSTLEKSAKLLELGQGLSEKARLLDDDLIDRMLALVKEVGDPRRRVLPAGLSVDVASLWAEVTGATYVLRAPSSRPGDTLVIAMRPEETLRKLPVVALELDDPAVIDWLHSAGLLRYAVQATVLQKRLGELELEALLSAGEDAPASAGAARRRQLAGNAAAQALLPPLYWELDAEQKRQQAGAAFDPRQLSIEARWALSVPAVEPEVVGHLLTRFVRFDYRLMAHHHPRMVLAEWSRYSPAKQRYLTSTFPYMLQGVVKAPTAPTAPEAAAHA